MVPRRPLLAATRKPGFLSSYPEDIKSSSAQPASTATGAPLSPELDTKMSAIIIQDQNNLIQQHCQQANYRTPDTVDDDTVTTTQIQDEILENSPQCFLPCIDSTKCIARLKIIKT